MPEKFEQENSKFEQAQEQFEQDGSESEVEGHFFSTSFGFQKHEGAEGFATGAEFPRTGFESKPEDPGFSS